MTVKGGAVGQLGRLLALIPWLMSRPGVGVDTAAAEFGVTPAQIRKDLELAFVCGLPGHLPDDLIDVSLHDDKIVVSNADTIARPLRLAPDEAVALLAGLRALSDVPGLLERGAMDRTVAKLERAAGDAADMGRRVTVDVESDQSHAGALREALSGHRRVHLRYYVPARDEVTERDVDPMRLVVVDGRSYLEGWCRLAQDVRLFRLDRIDDVTVLDLPAAPPATARGRNLDYGVFAVTEASFSLVLEVAARAQWIADTYPSEIVARRDDGGAVVKLYAGDRAWAVRLLLQLGDAVEVVEPRDIADEVAQIAQRALLAYRLP